MFAERLLYMADQLETVVPAKRFNMLTWFKGKFCGKPKEHTHHTCKTAACMMGWGTTFPKFKKLGLKNVGGAPTIKGEDGRDHTGYEAGKYLFDINDLEAGYLFSPNDPYGRPRDKETPKQAALRIRKFVKLRSQLPEYLEHLDIRRLHDMKYEW